MGVLNLSPIRQCSLEGGSVSALLQTEKNNLAARIQWKKNCCILYAGIKDWSSADRDPLRTRTRVILRCAAPLIMYSLCITLIAFCAIMQSEEQLYGLGVAAGSTVLCTYFIFHTCAFCLKKDENIIPKSLYEMLLVSNIRNKIKLISAFQDNLRAGVGTDPKGVAQLIASIPISPETAALLLELGSVKEFHEMSEELRRLNIPPFQLDSLHEVLRMLIEAPPVDQLLFRENVLRASCLLETEEDYLELRKSLPPGDPRLQLLQYSGDVSDADSAQSESKDSIYIDIPSEEPDPFVIQIGEVSLPVDFALLQKKSPWFSSYYDRNGVKSGEKIVLPDEIIYRDYLIQILRNLNQIPSLWQPMEANKKEEYLNLLECLHYYSFIQDLHCLGGAMIDGLTLRRSERIYIATKVVTSTYVTPQILDAWWERIYASIKKVKKKEYAKDLDFCLTFFKDRVVLLYSEYLETKRGYFDPKLIKAIVKRRKQLERAEQRIIAVLLSQLESCSFDAAPYMEEKEFLEWFAQVLNRSKHAISVNNFEALWPLHEKNKQIHDILVEFASANQLGVVSIWKPGEVPNELINLLPF